jgi:hypothetical protein
LPNEVQVAIYYRQRATLTGPLPATEHKAGVLIPCELTIAIPGGDIVRQRVKEKLAGFYWHLRISPACRSRIGQTTHALSGIMQ